MSPMNAPSEFLDYGPDAILMAGLTGRNWRLADYVERGGGQRDASLIPVDGGIHRSIDPNTISCVAII